MLDELGLLRALWAKGGEDIFGVTMSLTVKYRKPALTTNSLIGKGIVLRETSPQFATIKTEIFDTKKASCLSTEKSATW